MSAYLNQLCQGNLAQQSLLHGKYQKQPTVFVHNQLAFRFETHTAHLQCNNQDIYDGMPMP